ncbi:hypothetical protein PAPYR_12986 [Paratrimastix pyriformis]|uniref:Uncharacterized protein n=1 Tax=Paratrimastix pyriformis TaxID=342808 RepID=A0ABQ8U7K9_9EUKA|nr:hypothetical protein PAPYR_12986 [Paratrimastix pyriformis]
MNKELSRDLAPGRVCFCFGLRTVSMKREKWFRPQTKQPGNITLPCATVRTTAPALPLLGWGGRFRGLGWAGLRVDAAGGPPAAALGDPGAGRARHPPPSSPAPTATPASPPLAPPARAGQPLGRRVACSQPTAWAEDALVLETCKRAAVAMCRGPAAQLFLERLVSRLREYNSNYDLTAPVDFLNWQLPIACGLRPAGDEVHTAAVVTPHLTLNLLGRRPCSM